MPTVDFPVIYLKETASTNSYLKELRKKEHVTEGTVVCTHEQTAGRGQMGNHWESEPGMNLTFSLILFPINLPVRKQFLLSEMVSLSILEILNEEQAGFSIKWPNDIYYGDRKICGILIENEIEGSHISSTIAGIGLNVNQTTFRSDAPNPVSLKQITGKEYDLPQLLKKLQDKLMHLYAGLGSLQGEDRISKRYEEHLYHGQGIHPFWDENGKFMASIAGVRPEGYLVLKTEEGDIRQYLFKEVSFAPPR